MSDKKILIVDDTGTMRLFIKLILSREGYSIEEAGNGVEALAKIAAGKPKAVLMDVMMPEMDGIECLTRIKANPETKDIPVIMVTTKGEDEPIRKATEAGCDGYVTKPISKIELLSKLKALLTA